MNIIMLKDILGHLHDKGVSATLRGDPECVIQHLMTLQNVDQTLGAGGISFLNNPKYRQYLHTTAASAVILKAGDLDFYQGHAIVTDNPHLAWAYVSQLFDQAPQKKSGIHPSAVIASTAKIADTATIGPFVVIEDYVSIGDHVSIGAHGIIEESVTIGAGSFLYPRVTVCYDCHLGNNVVLHPGVVIGSQGFGFAKASQGFVDIAQVGAVILEDDVNIGANTCVDRGAIEDTRLKKGTRLDNLVQIAHNVVVGEHTIIAGCSAIAGSTVIGNHVTLAGAVAVNGHINITDNVMITGFTMVTHSLNTSGVYSSGLPVMDNQAWRHMIAKIKRIGTLYDRVKALENEVRS